ncbi:hybrid sensor histidine kinase/response regulator [Candidatus Cyanaurora vandensis]|uniref:hybrid sensor histidine kinase/response regulator n=1 Tax=Candidatus Cyanaurora vandensis TaxID=2714958 RepID=UPI00257D39A7|nr:hybrid sensor histidine kinase/response regulator [Candidatus Cyanaurora vandensis]
MALDYDIRLQAAEYFAQEAPELLAVIEQELLQLKTQRTINRVHNLMRAAHSLKGGAATVGLGLITDLSHKLEDSFKGLYRESLVLDAELEELLFAGFDHLRTLVMAQVSGEKVDEAAVRATAQGIFQQIEQKLGGFQDEDERLLDSTDLGVDIVLSIFTVDVAQGIERIEMILTTGQPLAEDLQAVAEVFLGLAELTNLPGFAAVSQTVLDALIRHPAQAPAIARLALHDWKQGQAQVLAGDRDLGGTVSPLLQRWTGPTKQVTPAELHNPTVPAPSKDVGWLAGIKQLLARLLPGRKPKPAPLVVSSPVHAVEPPLSALSLEDIFGSVESVVLPSLEPDLTEAITESHPSAELPLPVELLPESIPAPPMFPAATTFAEVAAAFDQLPPATDLIPVVPTTPVPILEPASTPQPARPTVRVDLERMDTLNNLVGELVINRNGLAMQQEQLEGSLQDLTYRFERFEAMGRRVQELCDRLLVAPQRSAPRADFDLLEFDTYGALHESIQEVLDEMGQMYEVSGALRQSTEASGRTLEQHRRMLTSLRDGLMWARMLPLSETLNRLPRMVRDLAHRYDKPARLTLQGAGVPVDRLALEKLSDPLVHLVRNAFDHGLESPSERQRLGKDPTGQIQINCYHQGAQTLIEVKDDGMGLDLVRIAQRAQELGLITVGETDPARLLACIFEPGFSTQTTVSELSGRGMGLDVVRLQLESIKGQVTVSTVAGQGTTFTLSIPLTLTVAKLLVFLVRGHAWALPLEAVAEVLVPDPADLKQSGGQELLLWREQLLVLKPLHAVFGYAPTEGDDLPLSLTPLVVTGGPVLVVKTPQQQVALAVEQLVTQQELVIKPFTGVFNPPSYLYGCTVLGDGTLVPVMEPGALLRHILSGGAQLPPTQPAPSSSASLVLVVDDSLIQRQTITLTLQKAGYRVVQAKDGREGLTRLQEQPAIRLVLCDIEMPHLDGFEFLKQCPRVPVVMLTSRSGTKHRRLAEQLGAKGYLTKPFITTELLDITAKWCSV